MVLESYLGSLIRRFLEKYVSSIDLRGLNLCRCMCHRVMRMVGIEEFLRNGYMSVLMIILNDYKSLLCMV